MNQQSKCSVCGDTAVGRNYSGLTCVSCRTFFTRSATKIRQLKCPKIGHCLIDIATRKCCPKCRLEKCFAIGMKIRNHSSASETSSTFTNSPQSSDSSSSSSTTISELDTNLIRSDKLESKLDIEIANIVFSLQPNPPVQHQSSSAFALSPTENKRKRNYALDLNHLEREILYELQTAMTVFVDERALPEARSTTDLDELLSWPKIYARRIVKFCKSIQAFRGLKNADQMALLKPFYYQILVIRSVFMFDEGRNGYPVMENESGNRSVFICLNTPISKKEKYKELKEYNKKFFVNLKAEMENDTTMRDLIIGQFFYKPRKDISCHEFIRQQYFLYSYLLKRYLEHKYKNVNQAYRKFSMLCNLLNHLDGTIEKSRIIFEEVNVNLFDELLRDLWGFSV